MIGQQVQRPPPKESNRTNLWTDFQREVNALAKSDYILFVFVSSFFVLGAHKQHYMKREKKSKPPSSQGHKTVYASGGERKGSHVLIGSDCTYYKHIVFFFFYHSTPAKLNAQSAEAEQKETRNQNKTRHHHHQQQRSSSSSDSTSWLNFLHDTCVGTATHGWGGPVARQQHNYLYPHQHQPPPPPQSDQNRATQRVPRVWEEDFTNPAKKKKKKPKREKRKVGFITLWSV